MTYEELVQEIREIFIQADVSEVQEHIAYQFNIEGEAEGAFYVEVENGTLSIEPYEYFDRDVVFTTSASTLLKIVKGDLDAVFAFTVGKLKVEGDFDKALKLQQFSKKIDKKSKKSPVEVEAVEVEVVEVEVEEVKTEEVATAESVAVEEMIIDAPIEENVAEIIVELKEEPKEEPKVEKAPETSSNRNDKRAAKRADKRNRRR